MRLKPEPYLIEAITYRWFGHVDWREDIDVGVARSKKDLLNWKKRDPIKRLSDAMINKKIWTIENQNTLYSKVDDLIDENWEKALKDDFPDRKSLLDNVYKYVKTTYSDAILSGFDYLLKNYPEVFVLGQGLWSPWYVEIL